MGAAARSAALTLAAMARATEATVNFIVSDSVEKDGEKEGGRVDRRVDGWMDEWERGSRKPLEIDGTFIMFPQTSAVDQDTNYYRQPEQGKFTK